MLKHPSNYRLFLEACGKEAFQAAISITFDDTTKAVGWRTLEAPDREEEYETTEEINKKPKHKWLALCWHLDKDVNPFPYEMDLHDSINFLWSWLQRNKPADKAPDLDGSVEPHAFRIESQSLCWNYDIVRVRPAWAEYGK